MKYVIWYQEPTDESFGIVPHEGMCCNSGVCCYS